MLAVESTGQINFMAKESLIGRPSAKLGAGNQAVVVGDVFGNEML